MRRDERGSVLVEAAVIIPLLMLLLFGLIETGMAWRTSNHVAKTVRGAVLETSRYPEERDADYEVLARVREAAGSSGLDRVLWVIVYRTSASGGAPSTSCVNAANALASGSSGITGECNAYHSNLVSSATESQFTSVECTAGSPDQWFCPTNRRDVFTATDRIGIAIKFQHNWVTGVLPGGGITKTDHGVAVLAPEF